MTDLKFMNARPVSGYCEESPKTAVVIALLAVALVGVPLGVFNKRIGDEGSRSADVSRYTALSVQVNGTVHIVRELLEKGVVDKASLAVSSPVNAKVTLIIPPVGPTNAQEATLKGDGEFDFVLSGIYWSAHDPIVGIGGENYRVGDKVNGYTIIEIRKTEVVFRSPFGEKVVKYFYDYLDTAK